jgi:hypothetical protein
VRGPCAIGSGAATAIAVSVSDGCGATEPLLAQRSTGTAIDGFLYVPEATIGDGATVDVAGPWQTPGSFAVELTGLDGLAVGQVVATVLDEGRQVGSVSAPVPAPVGGAVDTSLAYPVGAGDATLVTLAVGNATATRYHYYYDHDGGPRSSLVLDGAATFLPSPVIGTVSASGVSWEAGGDGHDGTLIVMNGQGQKGSSAGTWTVIAPPSAGAVTLPALPDDLEAAWLPLFVRAQVVSVESSALDGYGAFREVAGTSSFVPFVLDGPLQVRMATDYR